MAAANERSWSRWLWAGGLLASLVGFVLFGGVGVATGECGRAELTPFSVVSERSGAVDPEAVTVRAVVTAAFTGPAALDGFFLQQTDGDRPLGLFVHAPALPLSWDALVRPGHELEVQARPTQWRGQAQLARVEAIRHCATPGKPVAQSVHWPHDAEQLAAYRNLLVMIPETLTVTGNWDLERYGSLDLAPERLVRTRSGVSRGGETLVLDDGNYRRFPDPVPYLDEASGTRRVGDRVQGLRGILVEQFDAWRLHPTREPMFRASNPRPPPPARPSEAVRIAAFNLENYFITLGQRGAGDASQLAAQRVKLLAAVAGLDADLLGLIEVENNPAALDQLLEHINGLGIGAYRALPSGYDTGRDAIRLAWVYREDRLELAAPPRSDSNPVHQRPPLMVAVRPIEGGPPVLAVLVHFKSKSRCPRSGDIERGDGCWNLRREAQAEALLAAVDGERARLDPAAVLLIGDFNAYLDEPPLGRLRGEGYGGAIEAYTLPDERYTFVFRGVSGMLDHVFVDAPLADRLLAAGIWHINADEPVLLGYRGGSGPAVANRGTPWRSSDHDPVFIDLRWPHSDLPAEQP